MVLRVWKCLASLRMKYGADRSSWSAFFVTFCHTTRMAVMQAVYNERAHHREHRRNPSSQVILTQKSLVLYPYREDKDIQLARSKAAFNAQQSNYDLRVRRR